MSNIINLLLTLLLSVIQPNLTDAQENIEKHHSRLAEAELNRLLNTKLFNEQLDDLFTDFNDMNNEDQCYYNYLKAYQTAYKGDSQKALTGLNQIKETCHANNVLARTFTLIANIEVISRNYQNAYESLEVAIKLSKLSGDKQTKIMTYLGAANVYNSLGQKDLSSQYSQLVYDLDPTLDNLCKAKHFNLLNLINDKPFRKQDDIFNAALDVCTEAKNSFVLSFTKLNYFEYLITNFQLDQAELNLLTSDLTETESATMGTGYKNVIALHCAIKARLLFMSNSLDLAKTYALKSLDFNKSLGNSAQFIKALDILEKVSLTENDIKKSYDYLSQRNIAEKDVFNQEKSKQLAYMSVKHANLAKIFEIEQLNQQNKVLALEKQLTLHQANNQRLIIVLILIIMTFLVFWSVRIKKRHDYFKEVSEIDHLTKVLTRKAFEEQVKDLLETATVKKHPVQVAIMDLDLFKLVNDNHGHLIGDWVLKNVIYAVKEQMTENMIIARLGGEEFYLVMADSDAGTMDIKLEKIRLAIKHLDCSGSGVQLSVTASFGVTSTSISGYSLPFLLSHADLALFEAKNKGRNQVVRFVAADVIKAAD